MSGNHVIS